ncbi:helix-turn-helix domain-containing protein [Vibrio breoganii]
MLTNRITRIKKAEIIKLRDKNLSHEAIASQVGCHRNTVGRILRAANMP